MKNKKADYSQVNLFLRSLAFSAIMTVTCVLYCFICLLAAPLSLTTRHRITRLWILGMIELCRVICHVDYKVEGWHNIKKIKAGIIMCKHQSAWETLYLQSHLHDCAMITKKELLFFPFFGWALTLLGPIAINRKNSKTAMRQLVTQGKRCLDQGRWVVVFPEGTRIPYGQVGKYKLGGARLSVTTGYPIIPVAHNAGRFWPRRQFTKIPGTIHIAFGEPIDPQGKTPEEVLELTQTWIENKIKEFD
jgi:1-acyl-sn-glycerol-3-phosphate acyltransferase